ncbi:MAG: hypothetical protein HOH59_15950 [Rhodospirillaceae bacterium]|nr:hypothetical protein [Rhodospirillaceae bacterium]
MKLVAFLLLYTFLIGLLFQSEGSTNEYLNQSIKYKTCLELAKKTPSEGYASATKWFALDKGIAARHCMAVSIFYSGDNLDGASRLEILERDIPKKQFYLRSQVLAQASQAWLLAGETGRATRLLSKSISLYPYNPEVYLDRATINIDQLKYLQALNDLDQAITLNSNFTDAYLYRAYVKRFMKDLEGALIDLEYVLNNLPGLPLALLERGFIRKLSGDLLGARQDWEQIIKQAPSSEEAGAARVRIKQLDKIALPKVDKVQHIKKDDVLEK